MIRTRFLFVALCTAASMAHADNPDPMTIDFPKNMEFSAEVTLLKADGSKPKLAPLKDGHRVQLRLDQPAKSTTKLVPCTLNVPKKVGQIASGEAAVIGMKCSQVINLPRDKLGFSVVDGGRDIGTGAFRP